MLRAWRALDSLQDAAAAKPWLLTILRREHARGFERKTLDLTILDDGLKDSIPDETAGADPERAGSDAELREAIMKHVPKDSEPLVMQVLGGFCCEEVSADIGIKTTPSMTQMCHAAARLRKSLCAEAGRHA